MSGRSRFNFFEGVEKEEGVSLPLSLLPFCVCPLMGRVYAWNKVVADVFENKFLEIGTLRNIRGIVKHIILVGDVYLKGDVVVFRGLPKGIEGEDAIMEMHIFP